MTERVDAERVHRKTAQQLNTVISHAPIILFATDRDGVYTLHEGKGLASVGLKPGQVVGQSVLTRQQSKPGAEAAILRALAGEDVLAEFEQAGVTFDCTVVPVRDEHGVVTGITGVAIDVTSRKVARAAEARYRTMIESGIEGIWLIGADGVVTWASPSTRRVLGYEPQEIVGTNVGRWIMPEDAAFVAQETRALVADPSLGRTLEFRVRHRDGSVRWIESMGSNMLADPAVAALVSNFRDVTARKAAESELSESQRLMKEAQRVAELGSWSSGRTLEDPITWSEECARIFGRDHAGAPNVLAFMAWVHPDDRDMVVAASERASSAGGVCETEHRVLRPNGEVRWVHARAVIEGSLSWRDGAASVSSDAVGTPYRVVGVVHDITTRKLAEVALHKTESDYRRIVENTSEGVWVYDANGITTFMNEQMAAMLGATVADAVGKPIFDFMDEAAIAEAHERVARRREGKAERGEFRLRRKDGSELWVSTSADPLFEDGRFTGAIALVTDYTDRRKAEESRSRLVAIVESSNDAIVATDREWRITSWNRAAERLYQWAAAEVIGQTLAMIVPPQLEPERKVIEKKIHEGGLVEHYETTRLRKDRTTVDVSLSVSPLHDAGGNIIGFAKTARDLTERKKAERALQQTEDQLRQAQKMEAVGVLAGGVAHDFNNVLSVILSFTASTIDDLKPGDPLRADLEEVFKAGQRAAGLTRQLLAFSRQQILQPKVINLTDVVSGLEKMLTRLLGEDIQLTVLPSRDAQMIFADAGQLEQVIMNLVVNARDAMPVGGNLTIETTEAELDASYASTHAGVLPGRYAMLAVTDTGSGMDRATLARIFDPFFTTKGVGKGTGLGLSTVYGIVKQSGGHIWVYSEVGKGTTFKVYLPRTDRTASDEAGSALDPETLRGTETILLVEDEDQVRNVMRATLRKRGYHVLEAQNGGEAFLVCEQFTAKIHLLLTDVVMPRMSGRQLAERLASVRPDMKVLYVSGYTENTIVHHGVLDAGISFLPKPIMPDTLLRKVRQVLDERAPSRGARAAERGGE